MGVVLNLVAESTRTLFYLNRTAILRKTQKLKETLRTIIPAKKIWSDAHPDLSLIHIWLALIKLAIDREDGIIRDLLLLAWSASVAKLNKTFLSAKGRAESRGGSSIFSIYRYKLASQSVELPIWETFRGDVYKRQG